MVELNKQFDISGPLGFHLTGHLLALAALIVACLAITGYITFRDDSIDGNKVLEDGSVGLNKIADNVAVLLPGVKRQTYSYTYPANAHSIDADDSLGPFTGAATLANKVSLVAVDVTVAATQVSPLGAINISTASTTLAAFDAAATGGHKSVQFGTHTANTAFTNYEVYPLMKGA